MYGRCRGWYASWRYECKTRGSAAPPSRNRMGIGGPAELSRHLSLLAIPLLLTQRNTLARDLRFLEQSIEAAS